VNQSYVIRFEGNDLVCFLVIDETDFVEIGREAGACLDVLACGCEIDRLMQLAEWEHGGVLPWTFSQNDCEGGRVAWTGPLNPVRI
jgi:hypothetical protein